MRVPITVPYSGQEHVARLPTTCDPVFRTRRARPHPPEGRGHVGNLPCPIRSHPRRTIQNAHRAVLIELGMGDRAVHRQHYYDDNADNTLAAPCSHSWILMSCARVLLRVPTTFQPVKHRRFFYLPSSYQCSTKTEDSAETAFLLAE